MCTVTWLREEGGYHLFCNRDEKLTRKPALPPRLGVRHGVRYLAPIDGDFGGTWISTNEFGVSLCLLNGGLLNGTAGPRPAVVRSRGLLLLDLVSSRSLEEVVDTVEATDLTLYASFTLAALSPDEPAMVIEWNGQRSSIRTQAEPCYMLTSSSFDTEAVKRIRAEEFARLAGESSPLPERTTRPGASESQHYLGAHSPAPGAVCCSATRLQEFHGSHAPSRSAYSPCMHRPDAATISLTLICIRGRCSRFTYLPAAPCEFATVPAKISAFKLR
jgi:hypothetical protein